MNGRPPTWFVASLAAALAIAACSDHGATEPDPDIRPFVIGAAAANLDASGHFVLTPHPMAAEISESQATALAGAYLRTGGGPPFIDYLGNGLPIHSTEESPCGRVFYAATRFESPG